MSQKIKVSKYKKNGGRYKYIPLYYKSDYERDEREFQKAKTISDINWNGFHRLMIHDIVTNTRLPETESIGNVNWKDIDLAFQSPRIYWKTLLRASEQLMRISPHYYRLNTLYSNMALFCWGIDLYGVKSNAKKETIKAGFEALAYKLENMNLTHEFSKIMTVLPYQDIFCGLVSESDDGADFFIQQVNFNICKLCQTQDGLYDFVLDLNGIAHNLGAYPDYVQRAFLEYKDDTTGTVSHWYLPPADKQICIKLNSQWQFPYPFLIGLVRDILDLDKYKNLKLQSARTDNYKAILIKVPIDTSTVDKPLLTPDTLALFADINRENMTDDIGLIHTLGSDGEAISFKDSSNTRNNVGDAVDEIYNSSGVSHELFNGSASGTALKYSIENDAGYVYRVYRQFERWVNRFIKRKKFNKSTHKFKFYLLDITIFNRDDVIKRYKESCTLGATVVDKWLAALGMTPSRILGSYTTSEDIYDFQNHLKPLSSTYNSSGDDGSENERGRPTNAENGQPLDEAGEKTEQSDANAKR